ncbi:SecDF P1 head subdomain-containing protein [Actinocorallia sp. A-T 12471]|uniref:SecDF P1 head subdomain-containing protein n=1 Tax=Actinocorallia sp. A-T 12471 TaxID=3089813 RepID=UPI0029CB8271|nr:hypothetical protein [Actinocorallia sp. A-T 12471]MDX6741706.1 hypothetical protein [Actinocorallia sp. A-T 12471]
MRRPPRTLMIASVVVIALAACAVALTAVLLSVARQPRVDLAAPLLIYPVAQHVPAACTADILGFAGPEPSCYQVVEDGIEVKRVSSVDVQALPDGTYGVVLHLLSGDRGEFEELTAKASGKQLVLVVAGRVVTAPTVDAPIKGGRVMLTGQFTEPDADRLAFELTGK